MKRHALLTLPLLLSALASPLSAADGDKPESKPIKALLVIGGCCHDYNGQKKVLTEGISKRANVEWTVVHEGDPTTTHKHSVFLKPDWSKGFDVVVHDECTADVRDKGFVDNILKPHRAGLPAVILHCGMHSYRVPDSDEWFKFCGITSSGHGPQEPIAVTYVDAGHPVTKGLENWTTVKEELYNNLKVWDTAKPLARGKQGNEDVVVAWTNTYDDDTRVFATTLGHNTETVADARYLDLVTRGLLWSLDKLDEEHLTPAEKVMSDPPAGAGDHAKAGGGKKVLVPLDLARGKPAKASAHQDDSKAPVMAVDGDLSTRWCAKDDQTGYWWQVDLQKPQDLTGCRITWEFDGPPYRYKIEGSADEQAWSMLADETESEVRTQVRDHKFDANGVRFVRVTVTGLNPGAWASFFEFEVFGKEMVAVSPSAAPQAVAPAGGDAERRLLAGIKAPPGFGVTLFAAPPDVGYPVCLAASPTGEVFVGVDENGSLDQKDQRGRIVRCVDTDGDGRADQFTTFAKADSPRGLFYDAGAATLYVLHPPFLRAFHDDNRDGVADRDEVLVNGIGFDLKFRGADHTTNGITMGIDGWIYVAVGDYGFTKAVGKDGKELQYRGGGVVRVRPDGTELEVVSRGQRNIYDVAVSPQLDLFTRDNTNDGGGWDVRLSHVIPGGQYGYPTLFTNFPAEIIQPLAVYGGGSPTGSVYVDENTLPEPFASSLYTCDWGRNIVYRHPLQPSGAGFKAEQQPFVELPRPTDMDVDAFGRIYIASWRDGGFNYSGPNVGYVVRVMPGGDCCGENSAAEFPDLPKASDAHVVHLLGSSSHVRRLQAQREILRRGDRPALAAGVEKLAASDFPVAQRVAAIFTLKQLRGVKSHDTLLRLAGDEKLRPFALRALADRRDEAKGVAPEPVLNALADRDARVRLQAVVALERIAPPASDVARKLLPLTADPDPLVAHAAVNTLVSLRATDACLAELATGSRAHLSGCIRVLQSIHDPAVVDGLLALLPKSHDVSVRQGILTALARLYHREAEWKGDWWGTRPDTRGPYYNPATWEQSERIGAALKQALATADAETLPVLLTQLQLNRIESGESTALLLKLAGDNPTFRVNAVRLLLKRNDLPAEATALIASVASSTKEDPALRAEAIAGLARASSRPGALDAAVAALASLAGDKEPPQELARARDEFIRDGRRVENVESFTKLAEAEDPARRELAFAVLLNVAANNSAPKPAREAATLAVDRAWNHLDAAASLLRAVGDMRAAPYAYQVNAHLKDDRPAVRAAATFAAERLALGGNPQGNVADRVVIAQIPPEKAMAEAVKAPGDPKLGAELFVRQGCIACHTTSDKEPLKGPFLGDIAARYSRAEIAESIVKPSAKVAQGFVTHRFKTNKDQVIEGFVVRESGDEVEVRNLLGAATVVRKSDIRRRGTADTSMMPVGLADNLTVPELASLLAYFESLKAK